MPSLVQRALHWPRSGCKHMMMPGKSRPPSPPLERGHAAAPPPAAAAAPLPPPATGMSANTVAARDSRDSKASKPARAPAQLPTPPPEAVAPAHPEPQQRQQQRTRRNMATVYVGPDKQRFRVNKQVLCSSSPFFRDRLEDPSQPRTVSLWLPDELPAMFALFVEWLQLPRHTFRQRLDDVVADAHSQRGQRGLHDIHWALIRLHLFASHLRLFHLQDAAMDAIQDLYYDCDWDLPPALLSYLYTRCEALPAIRLRRWAVAMVAFALTTSETYVISPTSARSPGSSPVELYPEYDNGFVPPGGQGTDDAADDGDGDGGDRSLRLQSLINSIPELGQDYAVHLSKMSSSGLDLRSKNPQMRISANKLRNDERAYGFRECSFHSHRSTVGERRCPHERKRLRGLAAAAQAAAAATATFPSPTMPGAVAESRSAGSIVGSMGSTETDNDSQADAQRFVVAKVPGTADNQPATLPVPSCRPVARSPLHERENAWQRSIFPSHMGATDTDMDNVHRHMRSVSSIQK